MLMWLLMLLWPLAKRVQNSRVDWSTARNFTVCIYWKSWIFFHCTIATKIISSKVAKLWFFKVIFRCSVKSFLFFFALNNVDTNFKNDFFWKLDVLNRYLSARLIILVRLTMTYNCEKIMISNQWSCGFMANIRDPIRDDWMRPCITDLFQNKYVAYFNPK